jgi:hypothetical protein
MGWNEKPSGGGADEARPLSRRTFIGATGAAGAGMIAGSLAPAGALADPVARTAKMSDREAAELAVALVHGEADVPYNRQLIRLTKHLSDRKDGEAVMRRLQKMSAAAKRVASVSGDDDPDPVLGGFAPPKDRISFHTYKLGKIPISYGVFFPHEAFVFMYHLVIEAIEHPDETGKVLDLLKAACELGGEEACGFVLAVLDYILVYIYVLDTIDRKTNNGGAALHATFAAPTLLIPTKFPS